MINKSGLLSVLVLLLLGTSASAAPPNASDDCTVLDRLLREAQVQFPVLQQRHPGGAWCTYRKNDFKCTWGFSTDRFAEAQTQMQRLERCAAAMPDAETLAKKGRQATFQLDPETRVAVRGPDAADGGLWAIELEITTTAKWN